MAPFAAARPQRRALAPTQQILSLCSARRRVETNRQNDGQGDARDVPPVAGQLIPSTCRCFVAPRALWPCLTGFSGWLA